MILIVNNNIGYLEGDICLDKDGVRAAAVVAEMANFYHTTKGGLLLGQQLDALYRE